MKKTFSLIAILAITSLSFMSCGTGERMYDKANYESMTNEIGTITFYSGGIAVKTYPNAKIVYSATDSQALFIRTSDGKKVYLQGDVIVDITE